MGRHIQALTMEQGIGSLKVRLAINCLSMIIDLTLGTIR